MVGYFIVGEGEGEEMTWEWSQMKWSAANSWIVWVWYAEVQFSTQYSETTCTLFLMQYILWQSNVTQSQTFKSLVCQNALNSNAFV